MNKAYIIKITQELLDDQFTSVNRRKIIEHHDRINFCCPYCGDSKNEFKKRGNIWFNKLVFICFNCGKKTNFDKLLKDFNKRIDSDKKIELIEHLKENFQYKDVELDYLDSKLKTLIQLSDLVRIFNDNNNIIQKFSPIIKGSVQYNYLISRGIPQQLHTNVYQGEYCKSPSKRDPIIILLNRKGDNVLGMQVRNLKSGKWRFFKIYNFETLYKWVKNIEEIEDLDINQIVMYNKLSSYYNILNVDLEQTVTVFEGYLDSLFFPNSIGVVGVNTDMRFLESNELSLRYFYDNDAAGFQKSESKIKLGYPVFLWKKLFEDIVHKKNSPDPHSLLHRISKIKDLNGLAELVPNPHKKLKLENFFSSDIFDMKWIEKTKKTKRESYKKF